MLSSGFLLPETEEKKMAGLNQKVESAAIISRLQDLIKERIDDFLPEEYKGSEIKFMDVTKNNDEKLHAVIIKPEGQNVTPTIYLEQFVEALSNNSITEDEILSNISRTYAANVKGGESLGDRVLRSFDEGFDTIRDSVIMQVVNTGLNSETLKDSPHREVEDLSIVYRIFVEKADDGSIGSIRIQNAMLDTWGIKEEDLYSAAVENTPRLFPTKVDTMENVLSSVMGSPFQIPEGDTTTRALYIITNEQKVNGAAVPFYDKATIDSLCDQMGGSMFLIPSSIHEMIAMPAGESNTIDDPVNTIAEMIVEINNTEVSDSEILGTKPYHYDKETGFMLAEKFEKLNMEKTKEKVMENAINKAIELNSSPSLAI